MLKIMDLIKDVDEKYIPMLKQVNILDFYKCIAQFSGLSISDVSDKVIKNYLLTWCKNKYRFFKMLGNKTRLDQNFIYTRSKKDLSSSFKDLGKQFPAYYLWLDLFKNQSQNKIEGTYYDLRDIVRELFPHFTLEGSLITHFFKSKLNAPDELVTSIGRIFENDKINAVHTISIDPVDMMLASENPYDWSSCYRLELYIDSSHADGCLAAILDTTSLITYVWNKEGKYDLYDKYKFKNIRYYRMRGWIAISEDFKAIHFNSVYPGRDEYDEEFVKQLRDIVETTVAKYKGFPNKWKKNPYVEIDTENSGNYYYRNHGYIYSCDRQCMYGYGEYRNEYIYINSSIVEGIQDKVKPEEFEKIHKTIYVFNERIQCPCGCGNELNGSDKYDEDEYEYNGEGFIVENFYEREQYWCDYKDDYCDTECCRGNCEGCCYWDDNHPICNLDEEECDDPDWDYTHDGVMDSNEEHCSNCPRWKKYHSQEETSPSIEATKTDCGGVTSEELGVQLNKIADMVVSSQINPTLYKASYLGDFNAES